MTTTNFTRHAATLPPIVVSEARKRYPDFSLLLCKTRVVVTAESATPFNGVLEGYVYGTDNTGQHYLAASVKRSDRNVTYTVPPNQVEVWNAEPRIVLCLPLGYSAIAIPGTRTEHSIQYQVRCGNEIRGVLRFRLHEQTYDWMPRKGEPVLRISAPENIPY